MHHHYCYLNGQILPFENAQIPLNDLGLLRAYGVFDFCKTVQGQPFELPRYLIRFRNSVSNTGMDLALPDEEITEIIEELLYLRPDKNKEAAIRLVMTGGFSENGINPPEKPNFFILTESLSAMSKEQFEQGVKVITYPYQRFLPEVKTTNYLPVFLMSKEMEKQKASDLLYYLDSKISECTRNNFFIFKGDTLITPKEGILKGITRQIILEIAPKQFRTEVRDIFLKELKEADEAFSSGTNKGINPITAIDKLKIGKGKAGTKTQKLADMLKAYSLDYATAIVS